MRIKTEIHRIIMNDESHSQTTESGEGAADSVP